MFRVIQSKLERLSNWKWALAISGVAFIFGYLEKGQDNNYINGDGLGYYAYLPAVFIYHDLSFNFIESYEKKHYFPGQHADFRMETPDGKVNRYYVGTAFLQLPFFLITHSTCLITGQEADGYSHIYQYTVLFAGCFYLFVGIWALMLILSFYTSQILSKLVPLIFLLATNLIFYTIYNPDFSHIYSFAIVNLFILTALQFFSKPSSGKLLLLFAWIAIIVLIRPINGLIVLLLPFFAGSWKSFLNGVYFSFKNYRFLIIGLVISIAIIFVQLSIYYFQTGHFWVYSYGKYGFNFRDPHFIDILFSYRKGLFLYSPVLFFSLGGFYFLFRSSIYKALILLLFLCLLVYILSSWDFWTYGMTYGQRPFIEYYALFSILLGLLLQQMNSLFKKTAVSVILILLIVLNLIQMSQHRHYILHWDEMNKEKYWKVFLRTDPIYYGYLWGPIQPFSDSTEGYTPVKAVTEKSGSSRLISGKHKLLPSSSLPTINFLPNVKNDSLNIVLVFKVLPQKDILKKNVIHIDIHRKVLHEIEGYSFEITPRNIEPLQWNKVRKCVKLPKKSTDEIFTIDISNPGKYAFEIDSIQIFEKNIQKK